MLRRIRPCDLTWAFLYKGVNVDSGPCASCIKHDAIKSFHMYVGRTHIPWEEALKPHLRVWIRKNAVNGGKCMYDKNCEPGKCHCAWEPWTAAAPVRICRVAKAPRDKVNKAYVKAEAYQDRRSHPTHRPISAAGPPIDNPQHYTGYIFILII